AGGVASPRVSRHAHRAAGAARAGRAPAQPRRALRHRHGRRRPLQEIQRHARPRHRRPGAAVGGGGIAFRYGGEEFSVLFPGSTLEEALPHLEAIRASIEGYKMAVRAPDRPKSGEEGAKLRGDSSPEKHLSVTVSIGACGPK